MIQFFFSRLVIFLSITLFSGSELLGYSGAISRFGAPESVTVSYKPGEVFSLDQYDYEFDFSGNPESTFLGELAVSTKNIHVSAVESFEVRRFVLALARKIESFRHKIQTKSSFDVVFALPGENNRVVARVTLTKQFRRVNAAVQIFCVDSKNAQLISNLFTSALLQVPGWGNALWAAGAGIGLLAFLLNRLNLINVPVSEKRFLNTAQKKVTDLLPKAFEAWDAQIPGVRFAVSSKRCDNAQSAVVLISKKVSFTFVQQWLEANPEILKQFNGARRVFFVAKDASKAAAFSEQFIPLLRAKTTVFPYQVVAINLALENLKCRDFDFEEQKVHELFNNLRESLKLHRRSGGWCRFLDAFNMHVNQGSVGDLSIFFDVTFRRSHDLPVVCGPYNSVIDLVLLDKPLEENDCKTESEVKIISGIEWDHHVVCVRKKIAVYQDPETLQFTVYADERAVQFENVEKLRFCLQEHISVVKSMYSCERVVSAAKIAHGARIQREIELHAEQAGYQESMQKNAEIVARFSSVPPKDGAGLSRLLEYAVRWKKQFGTFTCPIQLLGSPLPAGTKSFFAGCGNEICVCAGIVGANNFAPDCVKPWVMLCDVVSKQIQDFDAPRYAAGAVLVAFEKEISRNSGWLVRHARDLAAKNCSLLLLADDLSAVSALKISEQLLCVNSRFVVDRLCENAAIKKISFLPVLQSKYRKETVSGIKIICVAKDFMRNVDTVYQVRCELGCVGDGLKEATLAQREEWLSAPIKQRLALREQFARLNTSEYQDEAVSLEVIPFADLRSELVSVPVLAAPSCKKSSSRRERRVTFAPEVLITQLEKKLATLGAGFVVEGKDGLFTVQHGKSGNSVFVCDSSAAKKRAKTLRKASQDRENAAPCLSDKIPDKQQLLILGELNSDSQRLLEKHFSKVTVFDEAASPARQVRQILTGSEVPVL